MKHGKKAAIQLTVNFIVVLIIGVILFGMGLRFAYQVFFVAEGIRTSLNAETEQQIELMLARGERVAIPINRARIKIGDAEIFGLGISNKEGYTQNFTVKMDFSAYFNLDGDKNTDVTQECVDDWFFDDDKLEVIENNENRKIALAVNVKKKYSLSGCHPSYGGESIRKGTYVFNVRVSKSIPPYDDTKKYGSTQQIHVEIK